MRCARLILVVHRPAANQLVVNFFEWHYGHNRREDLFLIHSHLVARAIEHRGLDEKPGLSVALAAAHRASPFLLAGTQEPGDAIDPRFRHQRPHLALRIEAGAQADGARGLADALQYALVALLLHEQ